MDESAPAQTLTAPASAATHTPNNPPADVPDSAAKIAHLLNTKSIDVSQAGKLAKAGNISTSAVAQALSVLQQTNEQPAVDAAHSPEAIKLDEQFGPVARPEEYVIPWSVPGETAPLSPEVKRYDQTTRAWLTELGLTRSHGQAIINIVSKLAQQQMSPEQVEAYRDAENAKLRQLYGDSWDSRFEPARRMIAEVDAKVPGLKQFLLANGVGDSSVLVNLLVQHAPIYHARKGR